MRVNGLMLSAGIRDRGDGISEVVRLQFEFALHSMRWAWLVLDYESWESFDYIENIDGN